MRVCQSVSRGDEPSEVMTQQDHKLHPHRLSPLFQRLDKPFLGFPGVASCCRPAALTKAQQVQSVHGSPVVRQSSQVLYPQSHSTPEAMQQHQREPDTLRVLSLVKAQGPDGVAVRYGDVSSAEAVCES